MLIVDAGVVKDYDAVTGAVQTNYGTLPTLGGQNFYAMSTFAASGQGAILTRITAQSDESYAISNFHFKAGTAGLQAVTVQ
jgi:hypothetical protein